MARQSSQTHGQTEQPNSWPDRAAKLMARQSSQTYGLPDYHCKSEPEIQTALWLMHDISFRQEMAGVTGTSWAKVDPSTYSLFCKTSSKSGELVPELPDTRPHSQHLSSQIKESILGSSRWPTCQTSPEDKGGMPHVQLLWGLL